jgi:hypothetical protein
MFYPRVSPPRPHLRSRSPYEEPPEDTHGEPSDLPHVETRFVQNAGPSREYEAEDGVVLYGNFGESGDCEGCGRSACATSA